MGGKAGSPLHAGPGRVTRTGVRALPKSAPVNLKTLNINLWTINLIGFFRMKNTFVVISSAGPNRDSSKSTREQPLWDEHAVFIDGLVAEGFVLMGGPFVDQGGSMLIVNADDEDEVREKLRTIRG